MNAGAVKGSHDSEERAMLMITTIGLDIAKSVFQVHGVDAAGEVVIRRQLKRRYRHEQQGPAVAGSAAELTRSSSDQIRIDAGRMGRHGGRGEQPVGSDRSAQKAARADLDGGDWIITIPRVGYRFVGPSAQEPTEGISETSSPPIEREHRPSIAVLPFANLGGDKEQEYLADGITEDIITALTRFRWFFVIARNSSFAYKGKSLDAKQLSLI